MKVMLIDFETKLKHVLSFIGSEFFLKVHLIKLALIN